MRKASKILCLIGGIFGLFLVLLWLILAVVQFVYGSAATALANGGDVSKEVYDWLVDYVQSHGGVGAYPDGWVDVAAELISQGVTYVIMALFCIPSAILSFILRKKEKTGLPLPIVLAVLSWAGNVPAFVGAGLAIANWAVVERKEGQQNSEEPKAE